MVKAVRTIAKRQRAQTSSNCSPQKYSVAKNTGALIPLLNWPSGVCSMVLVIDIGSIEKNRRVAPTSYSPAKNSFRTWIGSGGR
jgi:hypothetical protein